MLCLAKNVGNTIGINRLALVVGVIVVVAVRVSAGNHGEYHECVGLRVGFLQVVSAVVPTALEVAFFKGKSCRHVAADIVHHRAGTVLGVGGLEMEPGFGVSGAVDPIELEQGVAHHGIDALADNECRGKLLEYLDAVAGIQGEVPCQFYQLAFTDGSRGGVGRGFVAALVGGRGVGSGLDFPMCRRLVASRCEFSSCGDLFALKVDNGIGFGTVACGNIVEVHFRVIGQVSRLVDTDTADTQVLCVAEGLVQCVGNECVGRKILGNRTYGRNSVVFFPVGNVFAETFYSTAVIGSGSVPLHGPNRAN